MDVKQVEQYILEVLTEKFGCEFEVASSRRQFEFRSDDYDFSFPITFIEMTSKQSIQNKVKSWIERDFSLIKPNSSVVYNANGAILDSSVLE